jgi:hypothetical protein
MHRTIPLVTSDPHVPARRRAAIGLAWTLAWTLAWGLAIFGYGHRSQAAESAPPVAKSLPTDARTARR